MGVQDQVESFAWLLDHADAVRAGKRALAAAAATHAGEPGRVNLGRVGKLAGCSASQVAAWAAGEWEPPTGQRLALLRAAGEFEWVS